MRAFIRLWVLLLLPLWLSACGVNDIPTYDEQTTAAWAQVENQYQRRADLIPNLVMYDPHFGDPRFVAEFLRRIKDDTEVQLFPEAQHLVDMRDRAMHHYHLLESRHYTATELRTRLASAAMDLLGRSGGLSKERGALAPFEGRAEWSFRISPIFRFGGGTNEVQRDIVAAAGLGLPR